MNRVDISEAGLALIREFEGFPNHGKPYRDPVGIWTRGYGRTEGITAHSPAISEPAAVKELADLVRNRYLPTIAALPVKLNQNQIDALASFVYNVGVGGISPRTGVGRALRAHDWQAAADRLLDWDKAGGAVLPGLARRRAAERELFLKPVHAPGPLAGYPADERRWIREYDGLSKVLHSTQRQPGDVARRDALRRVMTKRRKRIWLAATASGWSKHKRRARYHSLDVRTRP